MIISWRFRKINKFLSEKNTYYSSLSKFQKRRFVFRIRYFFWFKEVRGMYKLKITNEMLVLIGSAAAQLSFGLRNMSISKVNQVHIFEKEFTLGREALYQGATVGGRVLCLSWNNIQRGFAEPTDNFNLGIHEMTHAIMTNFRATNNIDINFEVYFKTWKNDFIREMLKIRNGENKYFRKYGGTNLDEFFAVATECFFETPKRFSKNNPKLYLRFCIMLGQDPMKKNGNYKINSSRYKRNLSKLEFQGQ
jgi:MtfA peptidase